MKFTDIIECSELIEIFGTMEILVLNTKYQLACESSMSTVSYEQLNDLKSDLLNITEAVKAYPKEYMDTNRIISEGFVKISKAKRTNSDISIFESVLDDMLIEFVNKRKSIVYEGDIEFESFSSNLQYIYDHYISETTNIEVGNDITFTGLLEGIGNVLANIKNAFGSKHDKLVARDQKWLKDNKKKLLSLDYTDIELEVPSDYKITFASLINHHDIFDKNFKGDNPSADRIARFKDKSGNLKNGLDNYYRTGSSRREIGLRKVSGNEAKNVVKAMLEYCNDFLSGKKYIDEKLDSISKEVEDEEPIKESIIYEAGEDTSKNNEDDDDLGLEDDPIDDIGTEDDEKEPKEEKNTEDVKKDTEEAVDDNNLARDRQTGITVLMTIAEERYFDYIDILTSLLK